MKNPKIIFAAVIGVVFCFAGYNLWSYFKEQQAIQIEEDRLAEERRVQREQERQARIAAEEEQRQQREAEAEAERLEKERLAEERRLAREAEQERRRLAAEQERAERAAQQLADRTARARQVRQIEEVPFDVIEQLRALSSRYITDNPGEFLTQRFSPTTFGSRTNVERLMQADTDTLMLFAAASQNTDQLQALIDIGMDVNRQNQAGFTPLMFAAAYNSPDVVNFFLEQGADLNAKAYIEDMTALHVAAGTNPNPDVIDVLVSAGADLEAVTQNGYTPILLACFANQNLEVPERLAQQGADLTVYAPDGTTVHGLCQKRVLGEDPPMIRISDEVNERIIARLTRSR